MSLRARHVWLVIPLALALTGCGGKRPVPVQGVLTLEGTPVTDATVVYMPDGPEGGRPATGFTAPDGKFELTTYKLHDGALPGKYRVLVRKTEAAKDPGAAARSALERAKSKVEEKSLHKAEKPPLPEAYAKFYTTPLRSDVPATGVVTLELYKDGR